MDRYEGLFEEQDEAHPFDYDRERDAWEADRAAIAEYESWFLQKTFAEFAEGHDDE